MTSTNETIHCADCNAVLPSEWASVHGQRCPNCGSTKKHRSLHIKETDLEMHDSIRGKVKNPSLPSKDKLRKDFFVGDDLRKSDGIWMNKERIIDRDADHYKEVVIDPSTGKTVHSAEEPLSKHLGHGSAKKRKPDAT